MLASLLSLLLLLTPEEGFKCIFFSFSERSHVVYQINRREALNTMQANILPFYTHSTPGWGQIKRKEV